jgi:fibronectin-binding autotransporter adhesin
VAEKYPSGNTPWSTAANWNGGTKPVPGDDVHANNFTVTIDENVDVASLRTTAGATAVAGGGFTTAVSRTVTASGAGIVAGTSTCLSLTGAAGQTLTVSGNVSGGASANARGINNTSTGTVAVTGNVTSGTSSSGTGINNASTGTINIVGNLAANAGAVGGVGANNASSGTINVTGNVAGGGCGSVALFTGSGVVTVTGNITGGTVAASAGASVSTGGVLTVNGDLIPGTTGAVDWVSAGKVILNGGIQSQASGKSPFGVGAGVLVIKPTTTLTHAYRTDNAGAVGDERTLSTGGGGGGGTGRLSLGL